MLHVWNDYVCYIQRKLYASPQVDHTKIWDFNNTFVPKPIIIQNVQTEMFYIYYFFKDFVGIFPMLLLKLLKYELFPTEILKLFHCFIL